MLWVLWSSALWAQQSWYVSHQNGSDDFNGQSPETPFQTVDFAVQHLDPGDTLFFMGIFANESYDPEYVFQGDIYDPHIWCSENTIKVNNLYGAPGSYITLKAYNENTVLKGDASNIFRMDHCAYITLEGFKIHGQVENIPLETAKALQFLYMDSLGVVHYRVPPGTPEDEIEDLQLPVLSNISRPTYTNTRGLYVSNVHHLIVKNLTIGFMPGVGLLVAKSDYVEITGNKVHDCSRKSYAGTHGLVVSNSVSMDDFDGYKMLITGNLVYRNFNEIYSWSPSKPFITTHIDEGKGISLQKNRGLWNHGRFLVANNITYWNGYSGVHANRARAMDFVNNTCYNNCYTAMVTYADTIHFGNNMGISVSSGNDIKMINNIVVLDVNAEGFPLSSAGTEGLVVENNLIYGIHGVLQRDPDVEAVEQNTLESDPLFVDMENFDFHLQENSPAIDQGDAEVAPEIDFYGLPRDDYPDLGAVEYQNTNGLIGTNSPELLVYPLPFEDFLVVESKNGEASIYDLHGKKIAVKMERSVKGKLIIDTHLLKSGIYVLKVGKRSRKLIKR